MTVFEKVTSSPEALGELLASLAVIDSPWEEAFHRAFCDSCIDSNGTQNCDTPGCPHEAERNNPTWWLMQVVEGEQTAQAAAWRDGRMVLEPGTVVAMANPLRVYIRAARHGSPLGEMLDGENAGTRLKTAWQTVEEVKKVHPNAEISIEVEV